MYQIEEGFEDGLSIEQIKLYAKPEFDATYMRVIKEGLKRGFSMEQIQSCIKPEFDEYQMNKVATGFEDGLSIEQILSQMNSKTQKSRKKYDDEDDEEYYDLVVTYDNNKNILFYKSFEVGSEEPYIDRFDEVQEAVSVAEKNENAAAVIVWDCTGSDDLLIWTKEEGELDELREPDYEYRTNKTEKLINKLSN